MVALTPNPRGPRPPAAAQLPEKQALNGGRRRPRVDDCRKTFAELSAAGVTFLQEPADRPYGVEAVMRDNTGNWLSLVEPKVFTQEDLAGF